MQKELKAVGLLFVTVILVGCSQMFVAGQADNHNTSIEGVWKTIVTPRNCSTGNTLGPTFPGILLFEKDGALTGTSTAASSVYGYWRREGGPRQFSFASVSLRYDANGVLIGTRRISQNVTLDDSGNAMNTDGGFQDFDLNGAQVVSGCSTATGTKF